MPRVVKSKVAPAAGVGKKPARAMNKKKLYIMPKPIVNGTLLVDLSKTQWKVGPSIGMGGFGAIYSACKVGEKNYDYVVKCEPHGNGPLFVEMHFYMRNAKLDDIEQYKKERGIQKLGMPYMLGNGSLDIDGQKHRYIVMPRYGSDISPFFLQNGRQLPEATIYRLALQMLDVYEYVHNCGYVHADLKSTNILLGYGKEGASQAYLIDYGLASHYTTKEFKPDPKKMHNGTIEYTSRDAHNGVATMRADLEILGYNLIEWSGVQLPWVRHNLLSVPVRVQQAKEDFIKDLKNHLKKLYPNGVPVPIAEFMKYLAGMKFDEKPDYDRCRKIFLMGLKTMRCPNSGDFDFKMKPAAVKNNKVVSTPPKKKSRGIKTVPPSSSSVSSDENEEIAASDDDDHDVFEQIKPPRARAGVMRKHRPVSESISPAKPVTKKHLPAKHIVPKITKVKRDSPSSSLSPSPAKRTRLSHDSPISTQKKTHHATSHKLTKATHSNSAAINFRSKLPSSQISENGSPSVAVSVPSKPLSDATTVVNGITPKSKAGKTYQFNFELDVSMDANVVVNVRRKKRPVDASKPSRVSPRVHTSASGSSASPVTRVNIRKVGSPSQKSSLHKPGLLKKKSKKIVRSP